MTKSVYTKVLSNKRTPQNEAIPGRESEMKKNNAGGVVFTVTPFTQLERFLILGSDKPTYYATEQKLTKNNAENVRKCLKLDGMKTVNTIVEVSINNRAPKNDPALFALAVAASPQFSDPKTVQYALSVLSSVARTGTHLMMFTEFVNEMRGWGRALKTAVGNWYTDKNESALAYSLVKYQNREGWSNRDLLRLTHVKCADPRKTALLAWATRGGLDGLKEAARSFGDDLLKRDSEKLAEVKSQTYNNVMDRRRRFEDAYRLLTGETANRLISAYEAAKKATSSKEITRLIRDFGLTREMIPTQFLNELEVWDALLEKMPPTALIRNLGKMTSIGLLKPLSAASNFVVQQLTSADYVKKGMVHPLTTLLSQGVYRLGHGLKGKLTWNPVPTIIDAMEDTFYLGFATIIPTGEPQYIAVDVSGSMGTAFIPASPRVSAAQAAAAMAMVTARSEKNYVIYGFSAPAGGRGYGGRFGGGDPQMVEIGITAKDTLQSAIKKTEAVNMGGTDCSIPMRHAQSAGLDANAFLIITDNETWHGTIHPTQALREYRSHRGKQDIKLVVMAMTPTEFSIADPNDPFNLDVVGFDAAAPAVVADFIRGRGVEKMVEEE